MTPKGTDDGLEKIWGEMETIRREVDKKHQQNRESIHELRGHMQGLIDRQFSFQESLAPYLGIQGKPGKLDVMAKNVETIMLAQERRAGARELAKGIWFWFRWLVMAVLTGLGIWHEAKK